MPRNPVYGKNITFTVKGVWVGKIKRGGGISTTIWYEDIPDPIYSTKRYRRHGCNKYSPIRSNPKLAGFLNPKPM